VSVDIEESLPMRNIRQMAVLWVSLWTPHRAALGLFGA
jgi:hypothetical protein